MLYDMCLDGFGVWFATAWYSRCGVCVLMARRKAVGRRSQKSKEDRDGLLDLWRRVTNYGGQIGAEDRVRSLVYSRMLDIS